ncbi:MAG: carboxypeptidase regulatory-like domain-containing protein, partial [Candidatus Eremiobacteraeota bacterium]|nr:carboxypeptidase regulatory-like domain-containing protein [Candidatus Eremiobacteraeota bacterium]
LSIFIIIGVNGCFGGAVGESALSIQDLNPPYWAPELEKGSISGAVFASIEGTDGPEQPLEGVTVKLITGESTVTDENGNFSFAEPLMGFYRITFSKEGYNTLSGKVNILPDKESVVNVELSEVSGEPGDAILFINGEGYVNGDGIWVGIRSIKVWEDIVDSETYWERSWETDWFEYPYTLNCHGVEIGKSYKVEITWGCSEVADQVEIYDVLVRSRYQVETYEMGEAPAEQEKGSISGTVYQEVEEVEVPIEGAMVILDTGEVEFSDEEGNFLFTDVPVGSHLLSAYKSGFNAVGILVTVNADEETGVGVLLTTASGGGGGDEPDPDEAVLSIVAHGYYNTDDQWVGVKKILVREYEDYDNRWSHTWDYDWFEPSYNLDCYGVEIGTWYKVEITWGASGVEDETEIYDVQVTEQEQTETYYH